MQLSDLRDRVFRDCAEAVTDNDRIDDTRITKALNDIYIDLAARGRCFVGEATLSTIDDIGVYARPLNMTEILCVRRKLAAVVTAQPLTRDTRKHLSAEFTTWRSTAKGTPERFFIREGRFFEVWPRPDVTIADALVMEGFLIPSPLTMAAAVNITSSTNATPIAVTATAHGLLTGDWCTIASHLVNTAANGTWRVTRTGANTLTLDDSVGNGVGGASGTVTKIGVPLMTADTDEPQIPEQFHRMLVHGAVDLLLTRFLNDDSPSVLARAQAARRDYEEWIPALADYYAGGVGQAAVSGSAATRR